MPSLIPAVSRTLAALETFAREKRELTNKEMARLLNLPDSSCLDLLHSLHTLGYLMRTPQTLRYYPSGRWYEMANQINEHDPLRKVAQEAVDQLAEKTNETVFFGILDQSGAKVVATQSSRLALRLIIEIGQTVSLHGTALGKALLGLLSAEELEARAEQLDFHALASHTITSKRALFKDLETSRQQGWYEAHDEGAEGVSALAISGWMSGYPVSIAVAGPSHRIAKHRKKLLAALAEARKAVLTEAGG